MSCHAQRDCWIESICTLTRFLSRSRFHGWIRVGLLSSSSRCAARYRCFLVFVVSCRRLDRCGFAVISAGDCCGCVWVRRVQDGGCRMQNVDVPIDSDVDSLGGTEERVGDFGGQVRARFLTFGFQSLFLLNLGGWSLWRIGTVKFLEQPLSSLGSWTGGISTRHQNWNNTMGLSYAQDSIYKLWPFAYMH